MRAVEERCLELMHLQLDNQLSGAELRTQIAQAAAENRKKIKHRWEKIYNAWRIVKHKEAVARCVDWFEGDLKISYVTESARALAGTTQLSVKR